MAYTKYLLSTTLATIAATFFSQPHFDNKVEKEKKIALEIKQKAQDIKETISIENLASTQLIKSEHDLIGDNNEISKLVIPSLNHSIYDEILLNKHYQATLQHFENTGDTSDPDCAALEATGLITLEQCNYISDKEFEFYSYQNGTVVYNVDAAIAPRVIANGIETKETADNGDTKEITDTDFYEHSEVVDERQIELTYSYNQLIEKYVDNNKLDLAKLLNNRLESFNPHEAGLNKTKYGW